MSPPNILALGLGELGLEVTRSLALHPNRHSAEITVLLRSKKASQLSLLEEWNVIAIYADIVTSAKEQLTEIFTPFHTVICCTGMYAPPSTQLKIASAVLDAKVQRYFPWQFGIDYDVIGRGSSQNLFDAQLDVRDLLRSQTITSWVVLSTGMFISFLFEPSFGIVSSASDKTVITGLGSWENQISVTSPEDIGRVVAELVFVHPNAHGVVYCSGDTISMKGLADVVERVKRFPVERRLKTVEDLKAELREMADDAMRKYRVVFAEGRGTAWRMEESFNGVHGMKMQSVEEWAKVNLRDGA